MEPCLCPNSCGVTVPRCKLDRHVARCFIEVPCAACGTLMREDALLAHHELCPEQQVPCPQQCGASVARRELPAHVMKCKLPEPAVIKVVPKIMRYHVCDGYCVHRNTGAAPALLGMRNFEDDKWLNLKGDHPGSKPAKKKAAGKARKARIASRTSWAMMDPVSVHWKGITGASPQSKLEPQATPKHREFLLSSAREKTPRGTPVKTTSSLGPGYKKDIHPVGAAFSTTPVAWSTEIQTSAPRIKKRRPASARAHSSRRHPQ